MSTSQSPKGSERMEKAFSWLISAFFGGHLAKGACNACSVGNIVNAANGIRIHEVRKEDGAVQISTHMGHQLMAAVTQTDVGELSGAWSHLFRTVDGVQLKSPDDFFAAQVGEVGVELDRVLKGGLKKEWDKEQAGIQAVAKMMISKTGYTQEELMKVEYAFETASKINVSEYKNHSDEEIKEDQFRGLCAVMDVLAEIDGVDSTSFKEAFEYTMPEFAPAHPELIPA